MSAGRGIRSTRHRLSNSWGPQHTRERNWVLSFSLISAIEAFFPPPYWNVSFLAKKSFHLTFSRQTKSPFPCKSSSKKNKIKIKVLLIRWEILTAFVSDSPGVDVAPVLLGRVNSKWCGDKGLALLLLQSGTLQTCKDGASRGLGKQSAGSPGVAWVNHDPPPPHPTLCSLSSSLRRGPVQQLLLLLSHGSLYSIHRIISSCFWWWSFLT